MIKKILFFSVVLFVSANFSYSSSLNLNKSETGDRSFTIDDIEEIEDAVTDNDTRITALETANVIELSTSTTLGDDDLKGQIYFITASITITLEDADSDNTGTTACHAAFKVRDASEQSTFALEDTTNDVFTAPGISPSTGESVLTESGNSGGEWYFILYNDLNKIDITTSATPAEATP